MDIELHKDHTSLYQKAELYSRSSMIPKQFRGKPADIVVAIETGREMGMTPLGALRSLDVIQGKVAFPAKTQLALMIQSPSYYWHTISSNAEILKNGVCVMKGARKGWPDGVVQEVTYSIQEAKEARLWASSPSWKNHPADMVKHRCVTRFIDTVFADVLMGITSQEHMEDYLANVSGGDSGEGPKPKAPRPENFDAKEELKRKLAPPKPKPKQKPEPEVIEKESPHSSVAASAQGFEMVWEEAPLPPGVE